MVLCGLFYTTTVQIFAHFLYKKRPWLIKDGYGFCIEVAFNASSGYRGLRIYRNVTLLRRGKVYLDLRRRLLKRSGVSASRSMRAKWLGYLGLMVLEKLLL